MLQHGFGRGGSAALGLLDGVEAQVLEEQPLELWGRVRVDQEARDLVELAADLLHLRHDRRLDLGEVVQVQQDSAPLHVVEDAGEGHLEPGEHVEQRVAVPRVHLLELLSEPLVQAVDRPGVQRGVVADRDGVALVGLEEDLVHALLRRLARLAAGVLRVEGLAEGHHALTELSLVSLLQAVRPAGVNETVHDQGVDQAAAELESAVGEDVGVVLGLRADPSPARVLEDVSEVLKRISLEEVPVVPCGERPEDDDVSGDIQSRRLCVDS